MAPLYPLKSTLLFPTPSPPSLILIFSFSADFLFSDQKYKPGLRPAGLNSTFAGPMAYSGGLGGKSSLPRWVREFFKNFICCHIFERTNMSKTKKTSQKF